MRTTHSPSHNGAALDHHLLDFPDLSLKPREAKSVSWSVPWSDLMMVMFILFLVLFVFALREKDQIILGHRTSTSIAMVSSTPADLNMHPLYEALRERLLGHEHDVNIAFLDDSSIVVSLLGEGFFEPLSAEYNPRSGPLLSKIGRTIGLAQGDVVITGFAEDAAGRVNNDGSVERGPWELAALRAAGIAEHFVQKAGVNPDMLIIQASGADRPLRPMLDERHQSRRWAEVRILP